MNLCRAVALAAMVLTTSGAFAEPCKETDFGPFSICVPPAWKLTQKGHDSLAGKFESGKLTVSFDYGMFSDPLRVPEGAQSPAESQATTDGLPSRRVSFTAGLHYFSGLHVPSVQVGSRGTVKLTVLAQSPNAADLIAAETAFSTIKFKK